MVETFIIKLFFLRKISILVYLTFFYWSYTELLHKTQAKFSLKLTWGL